MNFIEILKEKIKSEPKKTIILPENNDERVISAAKQVLKEELCNILFIDSSPVKEANIIKKQDHIDEFANAFYDLRKDKGVSKDDAVKIVSDNTYFGTMCVHLGLSDGMVSGAIHTTADTIRPAFQIIKTKKDISVVSGSFFMVFKDKVMVFADCAVNPNPDSNQLAQIAASTVDTAQIFYKKDEIKLAFISYSTGSSAKGPSIDIVNNAIKIFKENNKDIDVDGPFQYDAAVNPVIGKQKMPNSDVSGNANVLIFPDLNTGNNVYKAVQQTGGIVAVGPILQGLNKPINDLSRGSSVDDIVNTILITSVL